MKDREIVDSWGGAGQPALTSAQGGVMGALDAGTDRPSHPHGAGALERGRQGERRRRWTRPGSSSRPSG